MLFVVYAAKAIFEDRNKKENEMKKYCWCWVNEWFWVKLFKNL